MSILFDIFGPSVFIDLIVYINLEILLYLVYRLRSIRLKIIGTSDLEK